MSEEVKNVQVTDASNAVETVLAGAQVGGLKYNVDICFVVDATASMGELIGTVQQNILKFYPDLIAKADEKGKHVDQLRIKVVTFRNYEYDGPQAITESPFFMLGNHAQCPNEENELRRYVENIVADGGSGSRSENFRENGLEALATAMQSDWDKGGDKRRHVIVLFSDIAPMTFEEMRAKNLPQYPADQMPQNMDELTDMWDAPQGALMARASKRLVLFAPDCEVWDEISSNWTEVMHWPAKAGAGLSEADYSTILDTVMNSI